YRQLSDYYRFTIVPARVRAPKDYPQIQIILKKPQASLVKRMFGGFFEDNIFHWWYSLTVQI
ncbi:MAG: hypothetical protein WAT10_07125, partial [Enterococcus aquimarinus]